MNLLNVCTYPLIFRFFSGIAHSRVLNRVPCALQQVPTSYLCFILLSLNNSFPDCHCHLYCFLLNRLTFFSQLSLPLWFNIPVSLWVCYELHATGPCCLFTQSCPTLQQPHGSPGSSVYGISQARILEGLAIASSDLPIPGIELVSAALEGRFFTRDREAHAMPCHFFLFCLVKLID